MCTAGTDLDYLQCTGWLLASLTREEGVQQILTCTICQCTGWLLASLTREEDVYSTAGTDLYYLPVYRMAPGLLDQGGGCVQYSGY